MPRKNKKATGKDQKGYTYEISYQPDWLSRFKVSRKGRGKAGKHTKIIFTNPNKVQQDPPGQTVKTSVTSDEGVDFTLNVTDPLGAIRRIRVEYETPETSRGKGNGRRKREVLVYTMDDDVPPPPENGGG